MGGEESEGTEREGREGTKNVENVIYNINKSLKC